MRRLVVVGLASVVLCRTAEEAVPALETMRKWMTEAGLELHPEKTKIVDMARAGAHFDFLGYRFWRGKTGKLRRFIRPKSRLTGKPDAGKPPVRFGGRGGE